MASITKDPNGHRRIQFKDGSGNRRAIRLGKVSQRFAEAVKLRVEQLNNANITSGPVDSDTAAWVAKLDDLLAKKLARVGLIPRRRSARLKEFLDDYIGKRVDVKSSTATVYGHTRRCLVDYFGGNRSLRDISAGDADEWRLWLSHHEYLADNTVRRRCGIAKQFFRAALRKRLITENPFAEMRACLVRENRQRDYFVTRDETSKILDACPDAQWRLLFALSRFGGLRCPSEHLALRWDDIDWERNRITIHSSKTEHHKDGGVRQVPIFPELRPYLEEVFDHAEPGSEYVITRYRKSNVNLRTQLLKIIGRAGLVPWPKLWQNLRATRATELVSAGWPEYKVCKWLGHTKLVAEKHYWQVTDEDFQRAAGGCVEAAQKAAQQAHATPRKTSHVPLGTSEDDYQNILPCNILRDNSRPGDKSWVPNDLVQVGGTGLEPATSTV